ncbi:MAG: hypothetical protein WCT41_00715 [Candidatus Paceibacterota bacterium]|jgi:hypothetical protein
MPQKKIKPEPPMMTRSKSMPIIVAAVLFDLMRGFFTLFWFFGPALAALYCTVKGGEIASSVTFGLLGTKTAAALCSAAAITGGTAISAFTAPFGIIMADAVGLFGFLVLGMWIVMTNMRILKAVETGPIQFAGAFAVAEIPFLGALPVFSFILWRLYGAQIRTEEAAHKKWEKETADARLQERNQQQSQLLQIQAAQQMQFAQQEAANDAVYAQAANDERYADEEIPEKVRKAA